MNMKMELVLALSLSLVVLLSGCDNGSAPSNSSSEIALQSGDAADSVYVKAPADAIVVDLSRATDVRAPFVLRDTATSPTGVELALPRKSANSAQRGSAVLKLTVETAGKYEAWIHARWRDGCGNSLNIQMDNLADKTVGQDAVYGVWHWVRAGEHDLAAGAHTVLLTEREAPIAVDQLLLTRDAGFRPLGVIGHTGKRPELRRFADDFSRSPGHGLEVWERISGQWDISFSLDPNRIANQYALVGTAPEGEAFLLAKDVVWNGCRLRMAVLPTTDGRFGALLDRQAEGGEPLLVGIQLSDGRAALLVNGPGIDAEKDLGEVVRLNQWHGLVIERWAWTLRVLIDDQEVFRDDSLPVRAGAAGLFVGDGSAIFDNVDIVQIPWQAEDGYEQTISWNVGDGAKWSRMTDPESKGALVGRSGTISTQWHRLPVAEIIRQDENADAVERRTFNDPSMTAASFTAKGETRIGRLAIRYGRMEDEHYRIGPYFFARRTFEDASDYLEFTKEEQEQIAKNPSKLRRKMKHIPLLENNGREYAPWRVSQGAWEIRDGVLRGRGSRAIVRHEQEFIGDMEVRFKCRLLRPGTMVEVELYGGPERGRRIQLLSGDTTGDADAELRLPVDSEPTMRWHNVQIKAEGGRLSARLDETPWQSVPIVRGDGGRVSLKVSGGGAEFDDIEFVQPRRTARSALYVMDRPETDWWREGGAWVDHGGVTCVLASSWLSLIAPQGEGMLWNKQSFGDDLQVAFNVGEYTEWFSWHVHETHSHTHHAYDNICLRLSPNQKPESGYRVEINSHNRTATVLYRNGVKVAAVAQGSGFPIEFVGWGESPYCPYFPRRSRITLVKRGGDLRLIINGREVLRYNDDAPLPCTKIGLGGYKTRANFSNVEIVSLASAAENDSGNPD